MATRGREEDSEKPSHTDQLLRAVLAEAQVVCVGQPLLIVGDFNADPGVIPCLAKGISSSRSRRSCLGLIGSCGFGAGHD